MQLEARQLAEQQRQVSAEADRAGTSQGGRDRLRQLAGEQERLAERAQRLERQLAEQGKASGSSEREEGKSTNRAAAEAARELERGRVTERMRQAAEGMRQGGDDKAPRAQKGQPDTERVAQSLEGVADRLAAALGPRDEASRRLGESLARAGQLQDQINRTAREIERLDRQARERGRATGRSEKGSQGQGRPEGQESPERDDAREMARLRDEYAKQLEQAQALLDRLRRDEPTAERAGMGFTFEGQGMTLSAPGTEAFKQDFSKWDDLRKQATQALERASTSLSQRLGQEQARDRLAAGIEDKAPAEYERQVDSYFKAIAGQKR
jgi:hypothetical protein